MKFFNRKKNKLINNIDNNCSKYKVRIGKGILGLVLVCDDLDKGLYVDEILNKELYSKIQINDILIKIDDIDITKYSIEYIVNLCKKIQDKEKIIELIHFI